LTKKIIESKVIITNKGKTSGNFAAIQELVESAEKSGFDAITHLTFAPMTMYNGGTLGASAYANMVKFEKQ
tara:strand:- start:170 stop:382 length:213 start_codon:yes stop_codon:yes gene_type:complete